MSEAVRIVVEAVNEGHPGAGYEAGVEIGDNWTQRGWYGKTPAAALFRLLRGEAEGAANLARAVTQHAETMDAIVQEIAQQLDEDLLQQTGPATVYEATGTFGVTQLDRLRQRLYEAENQLDALHRCEHGRRHGVDCAYCPDRISVGGILDTAPLAASQAPDAPSLGE